MRCWLELPVFSRSVSVIDSNSAVRMQNDAASSSSLMKPGLYFLPIMASAVAVKPSAANRDEVHAESDSPPILNQT